MCDNRSGFFFFPKWLFTAPRKLGVIPAQLSFISHSLEQNWEGLQKPLLQKFLSGYNCACEEPVTGADEALKIQGCV